MTSTLHRRAVLALAAAAYLIAPAAQAAAFEGDATLGKPTAKVKVVEYASVTCPHCAHFHAETFATLKTKYIDTGRVHFTFREIPTAPAELAAAGFLVARCAGPKKYFSVIDALFRRQGEMMTPGARPGDILKSIAQENGLNEAAYQACLADAKALEAFNTRVERAITQDKINETPTLFVNGRKLTGEPTLANLEAAIASAAK